MVYSITRKIKKRKKLYTPEIFIKKYWRDYSFEKHDLLDKICKDYSEYPYSNEYFINDYIQVKNTCNICKDINMRDYAMIKIFTHIEWYDLFEIWKNPPLSFLRKFKKQIKWNSYFKICKITEKTIKEFKGYEYKYAMLNNKYFKDNLIHKFKHYYINKKNLVLTFIENKSDKKIIVNNIHNIVKNYTCMGIILKKFNFNEKEFNKILKLTKDSDCCSLIRDNLDNQSLLSEEYKNKLKMLYELRR